MSIFTRHQCRYHFSSFSKLVNKHIKYIILSKCSGGVDPLAITPPKVADEARSKHIHLLSSKRIGFIPMVLSRIKQCPTQAPAWQVSRRRLRQLEVIENLLKEEKRFRQLCELKQRQDELQHLENLKQLQSVKPVQHQTIPALPPQQCTMVCKLLCLKYFISEVGAKSLHHCGSSQAWTLWRLNLCLIQACVQASFYWIQLCVYAHYLYVIYIHYMYYIYIKIIYYMYNINHIYIHVYI